MKTETDTPAVGAQVDRRVRRMAGLSTDGIIEILLLASVIAAITYLFWATHKDAPQVRAACEARGGMLISTRGAFYSCVGKPLVAAEGK